MKLEDLVPLLELCKKIPAGEFEDSCFVRIGEDTIVLRSNVRVVSGRQDDIYPAPTVQEIMAELPDDNGCTAWFCQHCSGEWSMGNCERDLHVKNGTEDSNPAIAALKLWLKLKGIEK